MEIKYYPNGIKKQKRWAGDRGNLPDEKQYYENGALAKEFYSKHMGVFDDDYPTVVCWSLAGYIREKYWYDLAAKKGPTHIKRVARFNKHGDMTSDVWFRGDSMHREGGPARRVWRGGKLFHEAYMIDGKLHRVGAAALFTIIGAKNLYIWAVNGLPHREKEPCIYSEHNGVLILQIWCRYGKFYKGDRGVCFLETDLSGKILSVAY